MHRLLGCFVILYLTLHSNGQELTPIPNSYRVLSTDDRISAVTPCRTNEVGWKCKNCTTAQFCNGNIVADFYLPCSAIFPDKPYCSNTSKDTDAVYPCVSKSDCSTTYFKCPGVDFYPNALDCKMFYMCTVKNSPGILYACTSGGIYNHALRYCKQTTACHTLEKDCNNSYKIIPYKQGNIQDSNLYVICQGDKTPIIQQCAVGLFYNFQLQICDFKCPREGLFANPENNTSFFHCTVINRVLVSNKYDCQVGTTFDPVKNVCQM